MSDLVSNATTTRHLPASEKIRARAAVAVARVLATLPPEHLDRALQWLRGGAPAADTETVAIARDAVITVSVRCSGRFCLDRSIATALVCRSHGVWPEWYAGVCTEPFRAHAWVAVDGVPVGEPQIVQETFTPTLAVLPLTAPAQAPSRGSGVGSTMLP